MRLSYITLKDKATRDIEKLKKLQKSLDLQGSFDSAINAAFTVYHLIQWKYPYIKNVRNNYIDTSQNQYIKILHDVVTNIKHAKVSAKTYQQDHTLKTDENIDLIKKEDNGCLLLEGGDLLSLESSKVEVKFGNNQAIEVLEAAIKDL